MNAGLWFALACGVFALLYGGWSIKWILAQPAGNERMRAIAAAMIESELPTRSTPRAKPCS